MKKIKLEKVYGNPSCYICRNNAYQRQYPENQEKYYLFPFLLTPLCKTHALRIKGYLQGVMMFSKKPLEDGVLVRLCWEYLMWLIERKPDRPYPYPSETTLETDKKPDEKSEEETEETEGLRLRPPKRNW